MKKLIYTTAAIILLGLGLQAQIKVWSGGKTVIGSASSTTYGNTILNIVGNTVFTAGGSTTSSAYIRGLNAYSTGSTPDYTWEKDSLTGIFHPGASNIGFTIGTVERWRINNGGQIVSRNSASAGIPDITWYGDTATGVFHPNSYSIAFTTHGSEKMRLYNSALLLGTTTDPGNCSMVITSPTGTIALSSTSNYSGDYGYHQINNVNRANTKAFAVQLSGTDKVLIYGNGNIYASSYNTLSDKTIKENIDSVQNALSKVKKIQGYYYNIKSSFSGMISPKKEIGLLAQDVETIIPEVVYTNDKGLKAIAYQNLVALLIEAIKEQDKKIAKIQSDLTACCNNKIDGTNQKIFNNESLNNNTLITAKLYQNTPNPFTQITVVKCFIPQSSQSASLLVFDLNGSLKKTIAINSKGEVNTTINGRELVSGMYYYTLLIDGQEVDTKKMILTE